jgi:hypothetical protein
MESIDITDSQFSLVVPSPNIISSITEFVPEIVPEIVESTLRSRPITELLKESGVPGLKEGVSLGFTKEIYPESSRIKSPNTDTDYSSLFFYIGLGIICIIIGMSVYNYYKNNNKNNNNNKKNVTFQNVNKNHYINSDF